MQNLYQKIRLRNLFEKEISIPIELGFESSDIENIDKGIDLHYLKLKLLNLKIGPVHSPFDGLSLVTTDTKIRDHSIKMIIGSIEIAKIINVKKVIFHSGIKNSNFLPKEEYKNLLESIDLIIKNSQKLGITILLENTYESPELFKKIREDSPLNFCLDIGHINCFSNKNIDEWLSIMDKRIEHVHLHDNDGNADQHLPLGKGKIDFEKILNYTFTNNIDITFETEIESFDENKSFITKFYERKSSEKIK